MVSFSELTTKMDKIEEKVKYTAFDKDTYYPSIEEIETLLVPNLEDKVFFDYLLYLVQKNVPGFEKEKARIREILKSQVKEEL